MNKSLKFISIVFILLVSFGSCKKAEYAFGDFKTPTGLSFTTQIAGADAANPYGDGSGNVTITASAGNAITYKIEYGDGQSEMVSSGKVTHKFTNPDTSNYTITVNAIGKGGVTSSLSKIIRVVFNFEIPVTTVQALTNGSSRVWVTDNDAMGHVGVGPATTFSPDYYAAPPNTRQPCIYDDEITFTKVGNNKISMTVDNKGQTFIIAAATSYYGVAGGDDCYTVSTGGTKPLSFTNATSGSTSSNSTQLQFFVPSPGIINFATGSPTPSGTTYEILSITDSTIHLRNIGSDALAWYQKLKVKP